jgi:hypothetical protein
MPKNLKYYKDRNKMLKYRNASRKKNYKKGVFTRNAGKYWSELDIEIILLSCDTDRVLAKYLGRSVQAIQVKRAKEMKGVRYV